MKMNVDEELENKSSTNDIINQVDRCINAI